MVRKGYTPEQIINKLREAEVLLSQGATIQTAMTPTTLTQKVVQLSGAGHKIRKDSARIATRLEHCRKELT